MTDPDPHAPTPPWTAPAAPPFGAPAGAQHAPGAPRPSAAAYAPPTGFTVSPTAVHGGGPSREPAPSRSRRGLGLAALLLAVVALVGASVVGALAAYEAGVGAARRIAADPSSIDFDWTVLTPVRDQVLTAEVSFWIGTVLGVWALVQGIIAMVKDRGRGWGVAAVVVAALGPVAFFLAVQGALSAGLVAGASGAL